VGLLSYFSLNSLGYKFPTRVYKISSSKNGMIELQGNCSILVNDVAPVTLNP
jgi:hypothetical protein